VLRLDRLLGDAGDGKSLDRFLATLKGVNRAGTAWESVCPADPAHRGLYIRIERVVEEHVPIAWCTAGCSDRAVLAALTERLTREAPAAVSGRPEPSTMAVENRARNAETKTPAARPSAPLGSEAPCESCSKTIVKTRRSRRFCSDLCRDVFHGRRKAPPELEQEPESQAAPIATPMLGLTEAALVLNCHRRTVRAYIRAGLFPGRLLAGRWKIRREDLDTFIERALRAPSGSRTAAPAARSVER